MGPSQCGDKNLGCFFFVLFLSAEALAKVDAFLVVNSFHLFNFTLESAFKDSAI